jgi:Na+-translocating ferredoxin:NAD+ oxidoreductase RnfC subunit
VECDPGLRHDEWLLANRRAEIEKIIQYLRKTLSLDRVVLAMKSAAQKPLNDCIAAVVPPRYPMGEEHFLIRQALGVRLDDKEIPAIRGILVLNLQSIYQIGKIASHCYDGGRFITVADLTKAAARITYVYPRDMVSGTLQKAFSGAGSKGEYRGHGVMSSAAAGKADEFGRHETFAAYADPPRLDSGNRCRRCGRCSRKCPMKISVAKIVQSADSNKKYVDPGYQTDACIQCGSCTFFCPAQKPVSEYVVRAAED